MCPDSSLVVLIQSRAENARISVEHLAEELAAYLSLLARWNRRMNLTSLPVDPPTDASIDRLIIEPLLAASWIRPDDADLLDVGSGGGSPALPLKIALPRLRIRMVEVRERKSAFLREAVRHLGLEDATVETRRFGEMTDRPASADLISIRAVRIDEAVASAIADSARPRGRLLWFTDETQPRVVDFTPLGAMDFPSRASQFLKVLERR